ncbi:MAG: esterase/lipase family protein, partial [Parahaliea sp.]
TVLLRRWLREMDYAAHGWGLGRNVGFDSASQSALRRRLDTLAAEYDKPVSLVGWSLGGIFARALAHDAPHQVERVVTLASPFRIPEGRPVEGHISRLYRFLRSDNMAPLKDPQAKWLRPPPVPSTAIYSRCDGIARWDYCLDRLSDNASKADIAAENIEVPSSHMGMGSNPLVMWLLAERLSIPVDRWRAFDPGGWRGILFGSDDGNGIPGENGYPLFETKRFWKSR